MFHSSSFLATFFVAILLSKICHLVCQIDDEKSVHKLISKDQFADDSSFTHRLVTRQTNNNESATTTATISYNQDVALGVSNNNNNNSLTTSEHYKSLSINSSDEGNIANASSVVKPSFKGKKLLRVHLTAIHVNRAEFPLSKLLFKLTLRLALKSVSKQLEQTHQVRLVLSVRSANTCSHQFAGAIAAEEYYLKRARLFIVSGCDDAIRAVSRLASSWKIPVMTAAGFGADLSNKRVHRTLIRVAFSLRTAVEFLFKIMKSFQWRRVNLIVDESDPNSLALRGSIEKHMGDYRQLLSMAPQSATTNPNESAASDNQTNSSNGSSIGDKQKQSHISFQTIPLDFLALLQARDNQTTNATMDMAYDVDRWPSKWMSRVISDSLRQCSVYSRVSVLLLPQQYLRKFMLSVYDQKMANGFYTFINLPLILAEQQQDDDQTNILAESSSTTKQTSLPSSSISDNVFLWRAARSMRNSQAKQAFESLMSIYLRSPSTRAYVYFANKVSNLANNEYSSRLKVDTIQKPESNSKKIDRPSRTQQSNITPYLASFYDSLTIYSSALNESLTLLKSHLNNSLTQSSSDLSSQEIEIHARTSELIKSRRYENMITGQIIINSNGDRETDYTLDDMNQMTGKFVPVVLYRGETRSIERLGRIHWSSNMSVGPTSDNIDCQLNDTCTSEPMTRFAVILLLMSGPLVLIMSLLMYFVYSRLSLEAQLVDHWWKIRMADVEVVLTRRKNANNGSLVMTASSHQGAGYAGATCVSGGSAGRMGGQALGTESLSSHGHTPPNTTSRAALAESIASSGGKTMLISAGGRFKANSCGTNQTGLCDRTEITKVTGDTSLYNYSGTDVCYGNITLGIHKLAKVALKPIAKFQTSRKLMLELRNLKNITHSNLCRFVGIITDEGNWAIVNEYCSKGSLREFFHNESMVIDWTFKYSIINDILSGLTYLNSSVLGFHGRLKSSNCLVNSRFIVKLSDYGPHSLYEQVDDASNSLLTRVNFNKSSGDHDDEMTSDSEDKSKKRLDFETSLLKKRIWLAPEHMSSSSKFVGSMKGDVYSFGLLLYEIITNTLPFYDIEKEDYIMPLSKYTSTDFIRKSSLENSDLNNRSFLLNPILARCVTDLLFLHTLKCTKENLYQELKNHGPNEITGPDTDQIVLSDEKQNIEPLVDLMKLCWNHDPNKRPPLQAVNVSLKKITKGVTSKKLLENLTTRMEQYTNNLETLVEAKLATLVEEKLKTEELLYQFVPRSIAALLREGQFVDPEAFECVTVFYSDIVGFTSLSSESSPMEVVDFLSDLYLCFDETLEQHDIFKVDTIGDAYIVASGLPQRNESKHVIEIACAALELRDRLRCFKIPHKPNRSLEMRVGIHSGPCIAGIVGGLNMPKYCVFGDTLTTGKFMESTGQPMKIHITEESKNLLAGVGGFTIEQRQPKITRDGLPYQTYWLEKDLGSICVG